MIDEFLLILEKQKKENLHSLYNLFDKYLPVYNQFETNKQKVNLLVHEYISLMIEFHELDISVGNDSYDEYRSNAKELRLFRFTDTITWGKHSNKKFSELINRNERYILWAIINLDFFIIENTFFLTNYIRKDNNYLRAIEVNLLKQYALEKYEESISYDDFDNHNDKWENNKFFDGFEGNIDVWNHYNQ